MHAHDQKASTKRQAIDLLAVLGCFALIAVVAVAAWFSYRQHSDAERAFQARLARDTALVLEVHARDTLASVDDAVRRIKETYETRGAATDIRALMAGFRNVSNYTAVASVADSEGRVVLSTLPIPAGVRVDDHEHFRVHVARDSREPFISKPLVGRISGKWSFHVTRRINRPDGSFGGVAIVAVDFSYWQQLLQEGDFSGTSVMALIGRDGLARASHSSRGLAEGLRDADWRFLMDEVDAGNAAGIAVGNPGGGDRLWAYRTVSDFPLVVAVGIDSGELEQRLRAVRAGYAFAVVAIAVLALLLTAAMLKFLARQRVFAGERSRSERAVRESEERLRTIAAHIGEGLALYDRDDRLIFFNEPYRRMQSAATPDLRPGLTFESLARDRAHALLAMGEITDVEAFVADRVAQHRNPGGGVIERRRPDGGYHLIREGRTADGQTVVSFVDITELKRREAELRESESRFRAMFEQAGLGITLREAHDRRAPWLAVNDRFCAMTGYTREELRQKSTADITLPEDNGDADLHNAGLAEGNVSSYSREKRIRRKDGSWLWVDLTVTAVPDRQGKPQMIIATYQDIDARKRTEERLRESEGRLRAIIAAEPECVAIVAPGGELIDMNPAGLRMLEASSLEEMRRWPFLNQVAPQFRRAFVRLQHSILEGQSGVLEFEAFGIHGKRCWLEIHAAPLHDASGNITALLGIARDVTERRLAREALAAERNLLRTVIDNLPDRIRAKDRDLRLMLANSAWLRARVPDGKDVAGLRNSDVLPPEKAAQVEAEDRIVIESGQPSPLREVMDGDPDNPRWYVTAKMPLRDNDGKVTGLVAISRDVTDFKRRSLEVEKLNAALEARVAERTAQLTSANEELEAFASSVSHDLRAPLRHIDGMSAALLEDCGDDLDAAGHDYLARIRGAAQRMGALIEDLLRLSRVTRTELKITTVDLSAIAAGIVEELRREYPGREVKFKGAGGLRANGDAGLLRAALMNLLQNAWKFTGKQAQAQVEFGVEQRAGTAVYFVRDNGAGFEMAQSERLFGTFQRLHTEREFPGTGIGLATVRRIMRRHGGDVWADAAPGKGATFYFTLGSRLMIPPPLPALPEAVLLAAEPAPAIPGPLSVLLVDDDADVLTLSARALRPDGYEILTAGTGDEAMAILGSRAVSIIVSDFSMPGMNGAQFLARAAVLRPATLRIIVSGQTMNRSMQAGLRKGEIHHYFEKQDSYEPVRACIREWVMAQRRR